jgi:hypothetical protein
MTDAPDVLTDAPDVLTAALFRESGRLGATVYF